MRHTSACSVACFAALVLVALQPGRAAAGRTVRVGVFDVEPLIFFDEGEPKGFYIDLLTEIARREQWKLEYRVGNWDDSLSALKSGQLDLLGSIAYSEQRDEFLDFTGEPIITLWSQVYVPSGSEIRNILDLGHQSVAIMKGDINGQHFREYVTQFGIDCDVRELGSLPEVFESVASGQTAAGVAPNVFGYSKAQEYRLVASPIIFAPFAVYFAVPQGRNADLIMALDSNMSAWNHGEGTFYHRRLNRWFGGEQFEQPFIPSWLLLTLAVVIGVAFLLILWNRVLKLQVRSRRRDLQQSEERYRTLFDSAGDAILMLKDGRFIQCNATTLELFRCTREQVIDHEPHELSPERQPDGRLSSEAAQQRIAAVHRAGAGRFEWTHQRQDGTEFDSEVSLTSFSLGSDAYMQAIVRDITARKRLESDLRHAQKMEAVGTLAGGIAHDFNNVLSAIIGFGELARLFAGDEQKVIQNLDQVAVATERARDLVQQILAFSRRTIENHQAIELGPIVEETVQLLRSSIPTTIEIESQVQAPGPVLADPTGIRQMVMNLATNAYQAIGDRGGKVTVSIAHSALSCEQASMNSIRPPGDYVVLTVSDNGPGIDETLLDKIFEPYFTTKHSGRGTGLGLAVVHRLVEEHEGWIDVHSALGEGSTFSNLASQELTSTPDHGCFGRTR